MGAKRITPEEIKQMIILYQSLGTYAGVAEQMGRSASTVSRYLRGQDPATMALQTELIKQTR